MKTLKNRTVTSMVLPLAVSAGLMSSPSSYADCDKAEVLRADAERHLAELCDAARKGDSGAMYWLGLAYIEGQVLDDYDRGIAWLQKAAFRGNKEAERMVEFISSAEVGPGC